MKIALYLLVIVLNLVLSVLILAKPSEVKTDILGTQISSIISRANKDGKKASHFIWTIGLLELISVILLMR